MAAAPRRRRAGFTLIEVLVALSIMALLALMSWRGLDAMLRTAQITDRRSTALLGLQGGLTQWQTDLDRLMETPYLSAVDWDGRLLRVVRASPDGAEQALLVVGGTQQVVAGAPQWVRWQSAPLRQRAELQTAWQAAVDWSRQRPALGDVGNAGDAADAADTADTGNAGTAQTVQAAGLSSAPADNAADIVDSAVAVTPLLRWQLLYFRAGRWVPADTLAAAGASPRPNTPSGLSGGAPPTPVATGTPAATAVASSLGDTPEGVRLVLTLPAGGPLQGEVVSDWFNPLAGAVR